MMAQALTFIGLAACLDAPLGLGCAFYPGSYQGSDGAVEVPFVR